MRTAECFTCLHLLARSGHDLHALDLGHATYPMDFCTLNPCPCSATGLTCVTANSSYMRIIRIASSSASSGVAWAVWPSYSGGRRPRRAGKREGMLTSANGVCVHECMSASEFTSVQGGACKHTVKCSHVIYGPLFTPGTTEAELKAPTCQRNSSVRTNGRVRISQRCTLHHWFSSSGRSRYDWTHCAAAVEDGTRQGVAGGGGGNATQFGGHMEALGWVNGTLAYAPAR